MEKDLFNQILDKDEKIVKTFKPNRFRFIGLGVIAKIIGCLPFLLFGILWTVLSGFIDSEGATCNGGECTEVDLIFVRAIGFIIIGLALLITLINVAFSFVRYKKTLFCYTNKRIIVRTGFIGADFQTLDFDAISAMNVRVDFLDKFVHPNTGTIWFASAATPMVGANVPGGVSNYSFFCIENPYEVYKEIKEFAAEHKDGKLMS